MLLDIKALKYEARDVSRGTMAILANWGVLHAHIVSLDQGGKLDVKQVVHLLRCELATRKRLVVATRLLGVYHRLAREENERRLAEALGAK